MKNKEQLTQSDVAKMFALLIRGLLVIMAMMSHSLQQYKMYDDWDRDVTKFSERLTEIK